MSKLRNSCPTDDERMMNNWTAGERHWSQFFDVKLELCFGSPQPVCWVDFAAELVV